MRRAAGLEPIGKINAELVEKLRQRLASRTKAAIVFAGQKRLLPRWIATGLVAGTRLRGS